MEFTDEERMWLLVEDGAVRCRVCKNANGNAIFVKDREHFSTTQHKRKAHGEPPPGSPCSADDILKARASTEPSVQGPQPSSNYLEELQSDPHLSWNDYLATRELNMKLQLITERLSPLFHDKILIVQQTTREKPSSLVAGRPMILFCGPPGTGKTHAMRMLAEHSGLKPYRVNMTSLNTDWDNLKRFRNLLDTISSLRNAIVFFDEAEQVLRDRSVLLQGPSATVTTEAKMVGAFLEWCDGLQCTDSAHQILLVLATNQQDFLDKAVISRCQEVIQLPLPSYAQRFEWFKRNARHLSPVEQGLLARASVRLSYRDLTSIVRIVEERSVLNNYTGIDCKMYLDELVSFSGDRCEHAVISRWCASIFYSVTAKGLDKLWPCVRFVVVALLVRAAVTMRAWRRFRLVCKPSK